MWVLDEIISQLLFLMKNLDNKEWDIYQISSGSVCRGQGNKLHLFPKDCSSAWKLADLTCNYVSWVTVVIKSLEQQATSRTPQDFRWLAPSSESSSTSLWLIHLHHSFIYLRSKPGEYIWLQSTSSPCIPTNLSFYFLNTFLWKEAPSPKWHKTKYLHHFLFFFFF